MELNTVVKLENMVIDVVCFFIPNRRTIAYENIFP